MQTPPLPRPQRNPGPATFARRRALAVGAGGAVGLVGYAVVSAAQPGFPVTMTPEVRARPVAVPRDRLTPRTRIGAATHRYEVTGRPSAFYATDAMASRLETWLRLHRQHTGQRPDRIASYGAWTRGDGSSWHHSGEAIDVAALRRGGQDAASARYDRWRDDPAAEVRGRCAPTGSWQPGCTCSSPMC